MQLSPETPVEEAFLGHTLTDIPGKSATTTSWPAAVLALMILLVPALGVTSYLMLQDTFKSALVAFGVLAAALLFFWQQRGRSTPLLWHGLVLLPLALMLYALVSMAWSHTYLAGVEAIRWFIFTLALWLGLNTFKQRNHVMLLAWGIHAGAAVASIWIALQFWLDWSLFPQAVDPASTFVNRNFFAEYAVCALPFSAYVLADLRAFRWLAWCAATVALIVVAIMMTGTRSALIAMVMLGPVFIVILLKYRHQFAFASWSQLNKALVSLMLVVGVLGMGSIPSGNVKILKENVGSTALQRGFLRAASIGEKKEYTEGSVSKRFVMWMATARMMMANPWTGVGAGAWEVQIPLYQPADDPFEADYYAHNEFLQLLSEYGAVVGGLFLAVLFAYLLLAAGKTWHLHGKALNEAPLRALTLASLLALMIVSNAGFPWRLASTGVLFAICLATLAASDARLGIQEAFFAVPLHWRPAFSSVMFAVLVCCAALAVYITQQAVQAEQKLVSAINLASRAAKLKPPDSQLSAAQTTQLVKDVRAGIAINPHYRKLTGTVADALASMGDWANALWIWESVAASRPNIAAIWLAIARAHAHLEQNDQAMVALKRAQELAPDAPGEQVLEIVLLSRTGHEAQATAMLTHYFDQGWYDYDLLQVGYAIGLKAHNWPLAIRALELRNQTWPEQAADAFMRMGQIYADPAVADRAKALAAFRAGLQAVPTEQKDNFRKRVPESYRAML